MKSKKELLNYVKHVIIYYDYWQMPKQIEGEVFMQQAECKMIGTILEQAPSQTVGDEIKQRLDAGGSALNSTFQLQKHANGSWTVYIVEGWKPPHQLTCVGKSENIAEWLLHLMGKPENKVIYISIMDVIGFRGVQYAFYEQ